MDWGDSGPAPPAAPGSCIQPAPPGWCGASGAPSMRSSEKRFAVGGAQRRATPPRPGWSGNGRRSRLGERIERIERIDTRRGDQSGGDQYQSTRRWRRLIGGSPLIGQRLPEHAGSEGTA